MEAGIFGRLSTLSICGLMSQPTNLCDKRTGGSAAEQFEYFARMKQRERKRAVARHLCGRAQGTLPSPTKSRGLPPEDSGLRGPSGTTRGRQSTRRPPLLLRGQRRRCDHCLQKVSLESAHNSAFIGSRSFGSVIAWPTRVPFSALYIVVESSSFWLRFAT